MAHRYSTNPPGKSLHRQPIPTVARVGNIIFSSAISGVDLATGEIPDDAETQIANVFANMKASVEAVGGTVGDIGKLVVYLSDRKMRDDVNRYWLEMFPDEDDRPVRHAAGAPQAQGVLIQLEFIAVIADAAAGASND